MKSPQARRKAVKEWKREWQDFKALVYNSIGEDALRLFDETLRFDEDRIRRLYERAAEIAGFTKNWGPWWQEVQATKPTKGDHVDLSLRPAGLPAPPESSPEGAVERAAKALRSGGEDAYAGAVALAVLAWAIGIISLKEGQNDGV